MTVPPVTALPPAQQHGLRIDLELDVRDDRVVVLLDQLDLDVVGLGDQVHDDVQALVEAGDLGRHAPRVRLLALAVGVGAGPDLGAPLAGQGAQAQQAAIDSTLCNNLVLIDCSKVQIDVRSFDSLAEITDTVAIDGNGDMVNPRIDRVSSDQLVFVTMLYHHKMLTPVGLLLRTSSLPAVDRTTRLLVNTVFVRSEPG